MIDLHTHLLPGVDDGSPSLAVSVPVLQRFSQGGVELVVCTPHLMASDAGRAPYDRYVRLLDELRAAAPDGPALRLGWEIMLDLPGADLRHSELGLGGSKAVLVEFPRLSIPPHAAEELFRLRMSGVVPVLAHPERYRGCTVERVEEWRRAGAVIQMDGAALLGSERMAALAREMLARGCTDVIASDNHGDGRSLMAVREWLREWGTAEHAELLTRENPRRLLADEPIRDVPPLVVKQGMLAQLKAMVLGRGRSGRASRT
ncbi:MAG TPA: CpsB/CapC family capsule biosynthesis tyrosine phosphatase [Gemmatimonadaceae bacterium]